MNARRRRLLGIAAAAVAPGFLASCAQKEGASSFPSLALPPLDGPGSTLDAFQSGFALINYWATWCAPCREEMPSLERLSRKLPGEVRLAAVTVDEDLNLAREWLRKLGITFAVFADPGMRASRERLRLDVLPETFLIAPGGTILERTRGAREWDADGTYKAILRAIAQWKESVAKPR